MRGRQSQGCDGLVGWAKRSVPTVSPIGRMVVGTAHARLCPPYASASYGGRPHSVGRIATEMAFSLVPLICSTKGFAVSSYFMVLRMPSQSVAPLKAFGFSA